MGLRRPRLNLLWGAVLAFAGMFWTPGSASACSSETTAAAPSCCATMSAGVCGCCGPQAVAEPTSVGFTRPAATAIRPASAAVAAPAPCQCRFEQPPPVSPVRPTQSRADFESGDGHERSSVAVVVAVPPSVQALNLLGSAPLNASLLRTPLYLRCSRLLI